MNMYTNVHILSQINTTLPPTRFKSGQNMTKVIFVSLWFCPIYPGALFLSAGGLFITYYVDRINLMVRRNMMATNGM